MRLGGRSGLRSSGEPGWLVREECKRTEERVDQFSHPRWARHQASVGENRGRRGWHADSSEFSACRSTQDLPKDVK